MTSCTSNATSNSTKCIVVVGSLNYDFIIRVDRVPIAGETVIGNSFQCGPGGKGANQAAAAAYLSPADVTVKMMGRVGSDHFGKLLRENLNARGVDDSRVLDTEDECTGSAFIQVEEVSGQNRITLTSGANGALTPEDIKRMASDIENSSLLISQLEVPIPAVITAAKIAQRKHVPFVLNPAPAIADFPPELLQSVDYLVPNETEASILAGFTVDTMESATTAGEQLLKCGVKKAVVITLGSLGAVAVYWGGPNEIKAMKFPAPRVNVVDTTGAGDTFLGAMASKLVCGASLKEAVLFGVKAGSLCVTRVGAASIPKWEEVCGA